jgi:P-type conjugative transfer protein TrbG
MKRIGTVGSLALALTIGGCSAQQGHQNQSQAANVAPIEPEAAPQSEATPKPITGAELLAQQPSEVRAAYKNHDQNGQWATYKTPRYVLYPFSQGPDPIVDCEPLRTTDLQLQAGETITDVAMGDTERWMATPASSGDPTNPTPHLAVKPQAPAIATNLTIYTTKHIYHLQLRSRGGHAMQEVEFYYPDDLLEAMRKADEAAAQSTTVAAEDPPTSPSEIRPIASVDPRHLNFDYDVSGPQVPWKPIRAFDDGTHVFIQMPNGMRSSDAPALLVAAGSGSQMVNYRVRGEYYVVDRLFGQAVMVSGVGRQQDRVTIQYAGNAR